MNDLIKTKITLGKTEHEVEWTVTTGAEGVEIRFGDGRSIRMTQAEWAVIGCTATWNAVAHQDVVKRFYDQVAAALCGELLDAVGVVQRRLDEIRSRPIECLYEAATSVRQSNVERPAPCPRGCGTSCESCEGSEDRVNEHQTGVPSAVFAQMRIERDAAVEKSRRLESLAQQICEMRGTPRPSGAEGELWARFHGTAAATHDTPGYTDVWPADTIRGLVRAAEIFERREKLLTGSNEIWDDEARLALEEARRRGWGKNRIGR